MLILAIDTSCDETSVAITWNDVILSNVISSQVDLHKGYGGVVPMIAMRAHRERIDAVIQEALKRANINIKKVVPVLSSSGLTRGSRNKKQTRNDSFCFLFSFLGSRRSLPRTEFTPYFDTGIRGGNDKEIALRQAQGLALSNIDIFAVTYGPGLAPALEVGIEKAKELALTYKKPLVAVDHMEGHIYSNFARRVGVNSKFETLNSKLIQNPKFKTNSDFVLRASNFPVLCLLLSGGHTELVLMRDHGKYKIIGETLDDAVGEAFDKVAKMLNLGYPGGPIIERLAREGDPFAYHFPVPLEKSKDCNFSYSGLKTSVFYTLKKISPKSKFTRKQICGICASFQRVAVEHLVQKTILAIKKYFVRHPELNSARLPDGQGSRNKKQRKKDLNSFSFLDSGSRSGMTSERMLFLGGGVVANLTVRRELRKAMKPRNIKIIYPTDKKLLGDNAAMIAVTAYYKALKKQFVKNIPQLERVPSLHLH